MYEPVYLSKTTLTATQMRLICNGVVIDRMTCTDPLSTARMVESSEQIYALNNGKRKCPPRKISTIAMILPCSKDLPSESFDGESTIEAKDDPMIQSVTTTMTQSSLLMQRITDSIRVRDGNTVITTKGNRRKTRSIAKTNLTHSGISVWRQVRFVDQCSLEAALVTMLCTHTTL